MNFYTDVRDFMEISKEHDLMEEKQNVRPTPITDDAKFITSLGVPIVRYEIAADLERQLANAREELTHLKAHTVYSERFYVAERLLKEAREQRDRLAALVGTIRQWFAIPTRNVNDITPEEHSKEIGEAVDAIKQQRDKLKDALGKLLDGLAKTTWSSWQTTTPFAKQVEEATEALAAVKGGSQ